MKTKITIILSLFTLFLSGSAYEVDTLTNRLFAQYVEGSTDSAQAWLDRQQGDGHWTDVDYFSSVTTNTCMTHITRIRQMARAFNQPDNPLYLDSTLLTGIENGLQYWHDNKDNLNLAGFWWEDIGPQLHIGPTLILMKTHIDSQLLWDVSSWLLDPQNSGQNRVWYSSETVWRGCVRDSSSTVASGVSGMAKTLPITTGDGIQRDFSFYQHGPMLYNGGYGKAFAYDMAFWVSKTNGLSVGFDSTQVAVFSALMLEGHQWMIRGHYFGVASTGRNISRTNDALVSSVLQERLQLVGGERQDELNAFAAHLRGENDSSVVGNRHFWRADYQSHRRAGFHSSVKMCSKRTTGTEEWASENIKNYYLPFGAFEIRRHGDEYYNIFPLWDWARIPGVTCPHVSSVGYEAFVDGTKDFVGGVSNGENGVAVLDLDRGGVTGKKAWFFFNNDILALGAGIKATGTAPVVTSVNQCWLRGDVWNGAVGESGAVVANGQDTLSGAQWVCHDSVGYVFPASDNPIVLKNRSQSGTWYNINHYYGSQTVITDDVFSLWLSHGVAPEDGSYEYLVLPGRDHASVEAFAASSPIKVIANTTTVQAARHADEQLTGMVFHAADTMVVRRGLGIAVDQPCAVLIDESGTHYQVSVSNPNAVAITVKVTLFLNSGTEVLSFSLPGGESAGKSVTKTSVGAVTVTPAYAHVRYTLRDAETQEPVQGVTVQEQGVFAYPVLSDASGLALIPVSSGQVVLELSRGYYQTYRDTLDISTTDTLHLTRLLQPANVIALELAANRDTINYNDTVQFSATEILADSLTATPMALSWRVSDNEMITVDSLTVGRSLQKSGVVTVTCSSHVSGLTASVNVYVAPYQGFTLQASADAYVRGGSYENINYGTETTLMAKYDPTATYHRLFYLKFSIADLLALTDIQSAELSVRVGSISNQSGTAPLVVYSVENDSWTETGIKYSNKPDTVTPLPTVNNITASSQAGFLTWDITDFLKQEWTNQDSLISFCVLSQATGTIVNFNSREASVAEVRPVLTVLGSQSSGTTSVAELTPSLVPSFTVAPNPFNPSVRISLNTALQSRLSDRTPLKARIYDVKGRLMASWTMNRPNQTQSLVWHARNSRGQAVTSGWYMLQVRCGSFMAQQKLLLLR
jgi:chondroitin AC lyase